MHERNPYKTPIDFTTLSRDFPRLTKYLTKIGLPEVSTIDFKNAEAQRCLTEALLWRDFHLKFTLPEDRLCPPVPNRLNYLLWIQDALCESLKCLEAPSEIVGIDVGIGASAIYPLLGCKVDPNWKFVGTEIDSVSFASAIRNVKQNNLMDRIDILKVDSPDLIFTPFRDMPNRTFAFTMCNPPFYADAEEIERNAEGKALEPSSVCTGAENEMINPGGEEAFVQQMVLESTSESVRNRCLWFTSMLGKLSSLSTIVKTLRTHKIDNYALADLVQGQTRRWVVAWTFSDVRLPDTLARDLPAAHHALLPPHNSLEQRLSQSNSITAAILHDIIVDILTPLAGVSLTNLSVQSSVPLAQVGGSSIPGTSPSTDEEIVSFRVSASRNSWSRKARRVGNLKPIPRYDEPPAMVTDISAARKNLKGAESWVLSGVWRRGRDRELFESFWSHLSRKVCSAIQARTAGRADGAA